MKLKHYGILVLFLTFFLAPAGGVHASAEPTGYAPLAPLPGTVVSQGGAECDVLGAKGSLPPGCRTNLSRYLRGLYNLGVALAGFFAVFAIVRGGFTLLFTDSILGHMEGKAIILRTLGGLVIVYSSFIFMNVINPQLGRDLDIKLEFARPTLLKADDKLLRTFTQVQLEQLRDSTEKYRAERRAEADKLSKELPQLKSDLADAEVLGDQGEIVRLTNAIESHEERIATLNLEINGTSQERLTTSQALNAETAEAAQANLSKATRPGGDLDQIRTAFSTYRTAMAKDPNLVIKSHLDEYERLSSMQKALAFGLIEHPPQRSGGDIGGDSSSQIDDPQALDAQVFARIQEIKADRQKQVTSLTTLNGSLPAGYTVTSEISRIKQIADAQICQIKNLCRNKKYSCQNLEPAVSCAY